MKPKCTRCEDAHCYQGKDCFSRGTESAEAYEGETLSMAHAAATVEGVHYGQATRLEETILFAQQMGYRTLGLAYCVGLQAEARSIAAFLEPHFEVLSVCCKTGGLDKRSLGFPQIRDDRYEAICNPVIQARLLDEGGSQLNIICGLCVGHDAIFTRESKAPVTTLIAKDRVLAHNPAGVLYCPYLAKRPGNILTTKS